MQIGIIGQGFVGSAIRVGLEKYFGVRTYDLDTSKCNSNLKEVASESDIIFVCLPTPMRKDGTCDLRILHEALLDLNEVARDRSERPTVVLKSTIPPGTTAMFNSLVDSLNIIFSPEFLTEARSFEDFKNQSRIILGDDPETDCAGAKLVKQMFRRAFPQIPIVITKSETAEMVKYFTNCFLATKVIFANQMFEICEAAEIDYDKVVEYALYDNRIGNSHLAVPGPDGDKGYGGHCFPKDLAAMIMFANNQSIEPNLLKAVEETNSKYRTNKDWEQMPGRAVSD